MGLEMGRVDHQPLGLASLGRQLGEDPVEHAQSAPANKAIIDRLVRTIVLRRIPPAQTIPDHKNNPTDDPPVIDPRHTMRQRKIWLNPAHLRLRKPNQITHDNASSRRH
jgi:hypothetical protein